MTEKSRFVESLKNVRQEITDGLKSVGWDREKALQKARELEAEQRRYQHPCPDCDGEMTNWKRCSWDRDAYCEPCDTCGGTGVDPDVD